MLFDGRRWESTANITGGLELEVKNAASRSSIDSVDMDIKRVIEKMETGEQDTVLMALQSYNKEVKLCCGCCVTGGAELRLQLLARRTVSSARGGQRTRAASRVYRSKTNRSPNRILETETSAA